MNNEFFAVSSVATDAQVNFEALPVGKITKYPLEKGSYKPYAQCSLCLTGESLAARMLAFEVAPGPDSELRAVLYPFRDEEAALHLRAVPGMEGVSAWVEIGEETMPLPLRSRSRDGEDLQGVYWGWDVFLPLEALERLGGPLLLEKNRDFPGNFYKLRPASHQGSCYPADFAGRRPFALSSMGSFRVVGY